MHAIATMTINVTVMHMKLTQSHGQSARTVHDNTRDMHHMPKSQEIRNQPSTLPHIGEESKLEMISANSLNKATLLAAEHVAEHVPNANGIPVPPL